MSYEEVSRRLPGLSVRLANSLHLIAAYADVDRPTMATLKRWIKSRDLRVQGDKVMFRQRRVESLGRKGFTEMCRWAGEEPYAAPQYVVSDTAIKRAIAVLCKAGYAVHKK